MSITPKEARERQTMQQKALHDVQADVKWVLDQIDLQTLTPGHSTSFRLPDNKTYADLQQELKDRGWTVTHREGYDCGCTASWGCTHGDNEGVHYSYYEVSW